MMPDTPARPSENIRQMLDQTDSLIARRYPVLRSLVILQYGKQMCAQRYGKGGLGSQTHFPISPVKSVTKSIVALLIGIAIDRKLIASVQQPLHELLAGRADDLQHNPDAVQLTLHHLLSMTTGFVWRGGRAGMEPLVGRMISEPDWLRFILALPVISRDVGNFQYNSAVSHLLSVIIEQACGGSTAVFAQQHLFAPLGIDEFEWETDPCGISIGGWGLSLSALSMAKIGQLCLDRGAFNGVSLVSPEWIDLMWSPACDADSPHAQSQPSDYKKAQYGYQWWIRGNKDLKLYCAEGAGGQMIVCIPTLRAVIVTSCEYKRRGVSLWPLFEKYWIPALV